MVTDLIAQAGLILITLFVFLWMQNIPQKLFSKFRSSYQAKNHIIRGTQLLDQARYTKDRSSRAALAKSAAEEADLSISLDPKNAGAHVLRALALDFQGFHTSACESLAVALWGECEKQEMRDEACMCWRCLIEDFENNIGNNFDNHV